VFATCTGTGTLCLWDAHRWQPLRKFQASTIGGDDSSETGVFCWGPDGDVLARAGGPGGAVELLDAASGRILRRLKGNDQRIASFAWSADGGTLAAGTGNGVLLAWDLTSAAPEPYRQLAVNGSNVRAVFLPTDPPAVVTADSDGQVTLWDLREGRSLRTFPGSPGVAAGLAVAPDGKTIACAGPQAVYLWDAATGALPRSLRNDPNRPASASWAFSTLAWSPDGRTLAAGDSAGRVFVWDADARTAARSFATQGGAVTSLAWSRAGQLLLSGGSDGTARAWDVKNGFREYAVLLPLWGALGAGIALSPEGDYRGPPAIEDHLAYVVQTDNRQKTLTPTEFRTQHGWVNEPWQVGLYRPGAEPMQRIYVKADAPGPFDGRSWETAFRDLQDALSAARPDTEIWVAAGVYTPDRGTGARVASFHLKDRVRLFGGFAGTETRVHERDPNRHETILSGDLNGDDGPDCSGNDENSFHVVVCSFLGNSLLDGFTIAGGNASGVAPGDYRWHCGGGLYVEEAAATIVNCVFRSNHAANTGAGIMAHQGTATKLTHCRFLHNAAGGSGGGFCNYEGSRADLVDCVFTGNSASDGGGLRNQNSHAVLERGMFVDNTAKNGGAMSNYGHATVSVRASRFVRNTTTGYGGAINTSYKCVLSLTNCVFSENNARGQGAGLFNSGETRYTLIGCTFGRNQASWGGALSNDHSHGQLVDCLFCYNTAEVAGGAVVNEAGSRLDLLNCTTGYNAAGEYTGGIFNSENADTPEEARSTSNLMNCILWGNESTRDTPEASQLRGGHMSVRHCCIQGWTGQLGGPGNSGANPLFIDPNGPDGKIGTADDDWRLQPGSPGRDAGDNSLLTADTFDLDGDGDPNEPIPFDLAGRPRIQNGRVDLGAYESQAVSPGARP